MFSLLIFLIVLLEYYSQEGIKLVDLISQLLVSTTCLKVIEDHGLQKKMRLAFYIIINRI